MKSLRGLVEHHPSGWQERVKRLAPGAHVAIITDDVGVGVEGRLAELELRDTILVLRPGPRSGYVFLFRKPCTESTVAWQTLVTGTGGLNVDATRVAADLSEFFSASGKPRSGMGHAKGYGMGEGYGGDRANPPNADGRWPPNLLLIHAPECQNLGTKRVHGSNSLGAVPKFYGDKDRTSYGAFDGHRPTSYVGEDGLEAVTAYECAPGCPVPLLDGQSGETKSGYMGPEIERNSVSGFGQGNGRPTLTGTYGDAGGASRFFPQFADEAGLVGWLEKLLGLA